MALQSEMLETSSRFDSLKWFLIVVLLIAAIAAGFYYSQVALVIRIAVGIVVMMVLLTVASKTNKGRTIFNLIKSTRAELRKIVWPTRQETFQTTLVIIMMVVITTLILWGIDSLFIRAVGWITR